MTFLCLTILPPSVTAQTVEQCASSYYIDLSTGYSITGIGKNGCGCGDNDKCELVHIIMRRTFDGGQELMDCPDISLTERWWREEKDLVDIYYAETCEELPESETHQDRYIINTDHLAPGDTISILVCKTAAFDENIIELSATPGSDCSLYQCVPEMNCPAEFKLRKDLQCQYVVPDFRLGLTLTDTCVSPLMDVSDLYTIAQTPPPGTTLTEDLFVMLSVLNDQGVVVTSCDISVILAEDTPPEITQPTNIENILAGEPYPIQETLTAVDTLEDGRLQPVDVVASIDPYTLDHCAGYTMTYRWEATDACGNTETMTMSFEVEPDAAGPAFASLPADIDTVHNGELIPILVDLVAVNPDGSTDGVSVERSVDPYTADDCAGYVMTYRWVATDSCGDQTEIMESFFVNPRGAGPSFITTPAVIEDIKSTDTLPAHQELIAAYPDGTDEGIVITTSIDEYDINMCESYEITYRWTAADSCGRTTDVIQTFSVLPDTLTEASIIDLEDLALEITTECSQVGAIQNPVDLEILDHWDLSVIITDDHWMRLDSFSFDDTMMYDFEMGLFHVIYDIRDQCGGQARDTVDVTTADVSAPVIVCPQNQIAIITDLTQCATEATWMIPSAIDNCDPVELIQVSGPAQGDLLGVGVYTVMYEAVDESNNTAVCAFDLEVTTSTEILFSCQPKTVVVDSACSALVTKEAIIGTDFLFCISNLETGIIVETDTIFGDSLEVYPYINQPIRYILCDTVQGICCENDLMITDTIAPVILCEDNMTISCVQDPQDVTLPLTDDCSSTSWVIKDLSDEEVCDGSTTIRRIIREYIAIDASGNRSEPCQQIIDITSADIIQLAALGLIQFPQDTTINCTGLPIESYFDQAFGQPHIDGIPIDEVTGCNISSSYTNDPGTDAICSQTLYRHWTITESACDHDDIQITGTQVITIRDLSAPVLQSATQRLVVPASEEECIGYVTFPPLVYADNCSPADRVSYYYLLDGVRFSPRDSIPFGYGEHELWVVASDGCSNEAVDTFTVRVFDNVIPVAACLDATTVNITNSATTYTVQSLDIGSYDNCGIQELKIRREQSPCHSEDLAWGDFVTFCCEDVGDSVRVTLRVIDEEGNFNVCWGYVYVTDKIAPEITIPPDLVISCDAPVIQDDMPEEDWYNLLFGTVQDELFSPYPLDVITPYVISSSGLLEDGVYSDNCASGVTVTVDTEQDIDECGQGVIYRHFTAVDRYGNQSDSPTQTIYIEAAADQDYEINWPRADYVYTSCGAAQSLDPDELGRPSVGAANCALFGISYMDQYFTVEEGGACTKIIRTWTVINWCLSDPFEDTETFEQVIKLVDQLAPSITCQEEELRYMAASAECDWLPVQLKKEASDDCVATSQLVWEIQIDDDGDGHIDQTLSPTADSAGVVLNVDLPIGQHLVIWYVSDLCGNTSTCQETIHIINDKAPTIIGQSISTSLQEDGTVEIWASDLIKEATHPCYEDIDLLISHQGIAQADDVLVLTCDQAGVTEIDIYAMIHIDGDTIIGQSRVPIHVSDSDQECDNATALNDRISGYVYTPEGVFLGASTVALHQAFPEEQMLMDTTNDLGHYDLGYSTTDQTQYLDVKTSGTASDGLTTRDLIVLQNHILGRTPLPSPYAMINGDVNMDDRLSATDIIHMRRVLLAHSDRYQHGHVWRYISAAHSFDDKDYPLGPELDGSLYLYNDRKINDILALKLGDVDYSYTSQSVTTAETRSVYTLHYQSETKNEVSLRATQSEEVYGLQLALTVQGAGDLEVTSSLSDVTIDYNHSTDGILYISLQWTDPRDISREEELCKITSTTGEISNLEIVKGSFASEMYNEDLLALPLKIRKSTHVKSPSAATVYPNPFVERTNITLSTPEASTTLLEICNQQGALVYRREVTLAQGQNVITITDDELGARGSFWYQIGEYSGRLMLIE